MALDLKNIDKKKAAVIGGAIFAGLIAVILTNKYINESVSERTSQVAFGVGKKEIAEMVSRIKSLEDANQKIIAQQRKLFTEQAKQKTAEAQPAKRAKAEAILSSKTPTGKRAISITVDKLSAVGGMIAPGDYIDVIAHLQVPESNKNIKPITVLLFQNVLVLAVGDTMTTGEKMTTNGEVQITFALDPQEAELLSFARQHGRLQLVLRSPFDTKSYSVPAANWQTLSEYIMAVHGVDIKAPDDLEPAEEKESPKPNIEIYRGGR